MTTSRTLVDLQASFESLSFSTLEKINKLGGLQVSDTIKLVANPSDTSVYMPDEVEIDFDDFEGEDDLRQVGADAYTSGKAAFCVLAGSLNKDGQQRSLLPFKGTNQTLLTVKLQQARACEVKKVWVMTDPTYYEETIRQIREFTRDARDLQVEVIKHFETPVFTVDNKLLLERDDVLLRSCGSGDLIHAVSNDNVLSTFLQQGGQHVVVVSSDNLAARPDSVMLGRHISSKSYLTCEVFETIGNSNNSVVCRHDGVTQVVEGFRLDRACADDFKWRATGTMIFEAGLPFDDLKLPWHRVKRHVSGRLAVQFERHLHDMTAFYKTKFVRVDPKEKYVTVRETELSL